MNEMGKFDLLKRPLRVTNQQEMPIITGLGIIEWE